MYIVTLSNGGIDTVIHDDSEKLHSGKVVKGINSIDSFTFSMLPSNAGFGFINEFTTLVTVYNTNKNRYEFIGRVLYPETTMNESGLITKDVTCESIFGFLCDSQQEYIDTQNWTVRGLLQHLIDCHNSQVEEYKHFKIGVVTATDANDNLYQGIQRENTWEAITHKLIEKIGGELRYRVEDDGIYIDYLDKIGETRSTEIALSVNMKSITREQNPTAYVTRLIPLGCKLSKVDENGQSVESEQRLDITSVNNGRNYIDDADAIKTYGIHVGYITYDDVKNASILLRKGQTWMSENNKVQVKYSITALDLSLIGLAIDDLEVHNYHPIKNALIGVDDTARIIKKTIDVCEEIKSAIEVGDNFKTLSDIQREQAEQLKASLENIQTIQTTTNNLQNNVSNTQAAVDALSGQVAGFKGLFFYIRYSAYEDGHVMTEQPEENTLYMGTCSSSSDTAPTDYAEYTWVKIVGEFGAEGVGVTNITPEFYLSTSDAEPTGGEWAATAPTWAENTYLWLRSVITYTNGVKDYTTPYCDNSWAAANDVALELDSATADLYETILTQTTEMTNTCNEIVLAAIEEYSQALGYEEFKKTVESQLALLSDEMTLKFTETIRQIENVDGDLQSKYNTITTYFTFEIDGLTIGQTNNPYKMVLNNDRFSMRVNGVEVLWIDALTKEVHTPVLTVTERFRLLGYLIEKDGDGNVNCEYIGGDA